MTQKENLHLNLKLLHSTIDDMTIMEEFFTHEKINIQFHRRVFLRNIFSLIETYLYVTKELIKIKLMNENTTEIAWQELAILNEKKVVLNSEGKVIIKDDFQNFEPLFRFTLNTFAKVFSSKSPDFSNNNFQKLKYLSKRRNDITHPKSLDKLAISDEEINDTISMFSWFINIYGSMNGELTEFVSLMDATA